MVVLITLGAAYGADVPDGSWEAGPRLEQMRAEVREQVEAYVAGLGPIKRRLARGALIRATSPCARVEIGERDGSLAITCDDQKTAVAPADGTEVPFTGADGKTMDLVHRAEPDGAIVQTFANPRGTRINRFSPRPDGGLAVEVTIRSPYLDEPLSYALGYE